MTPLRDSEYCACAASNKDQGKQNVIEVSKVSVMRLCAASSASGDSGIWSMGRMALHAVLGCERPLADSLS